MYTIFKALTSAHACCGHLFAARCRPPSAHGAVVGAALQAAVALGVQIADAVAGHTTALASAAEVVYSEASLSLNG